MPRLKKIVPRNKRTPPHTLRPKGRRVYRNTRTVRMLLYALHIIQELRSHKGAIYPDTGGITV